MDGNTVLKPRAIDDQLRRIMSSPEFKATSRQKKFLQFVVEKTVEGRADEIKGYTIATSFFGRKETFDQATDPIVSVEARRLRRAIEHYYLVAGMQDPVVIDIPTGGYVPAFLCRAALESDSPLTETKLDEGGNIGGSPSVLIRPFQVLSEDTNPNFVAEGFTTELAIELSRYQDIQILMKPSDPEGQSTREPKARFLMEGSIRHGLHKLKLVVQLFDQKIGSQIWGDVYNCNLKTADLFAFQEEVAQIIAATVAEQEGFITRTLSIESRNTPPSEMDTYEAIHKFYKFETTFSQEAFHDAIELNPYVRAYNYYILCLDWLRQKEYEKAYLETLNFRLPFLWWDPGLRAITLGHLGRSNEGNRSVEEILKLKPDFPARGRLLIKHFIKSDELIEDLIEGLKKAGLDLK